MARTAQFWFVSTGLLLLLAVPVVAEQTTEACFDDVSSLRDSSSSDRSWVNNDAEDLDLNLVWASDPEDASCLNLISFDFSEAQENPGLTYVKDFRPKNSSFVWVGLNGASEGVVLYVPLKAQASDCLGSLAETAVHALLPTNKEKRPMSSLFEPKSLLTSTGQPILDWEDIANTKNVIHVLLDRESWMWPGVEIGFSRNISGIELVTVSMQPRIFLAKNVINDEDIEDIISNGAPSLFRSPERHYSDDPKYKNYRTSETGNLRDSHTPSLKLRFRSWQLLRLRELEYVEPLQLLRYTPGKWYKEHYDVFHNLPPISKTDELVQMESIGLPLVEWSARQRYLLWLVYHDPSLLPNDPSLANDMRALYCSPQSDWYPSLESEEFAEMLMNVYGAKSLAEISALVDLVDAQIAWISGAFCKDIEEQEECIIHVSEAFDNIYEMFPLENVDFVSLQRNRHVTMLPYLTDVEEGGETVFPLANGKGLFGNSKSLKRDGMSECSRGLFVPPVKGAAAIFYHLDPSGRQIDQLSMHGGCPPVKGVKYAVNVFCWNLPSEDGLRMMNQAKH